jgi:hypothetical protein
MSMISRARAELTMLSIRTQSNDSQTLYKVDGKQGSPISIRLHGHYDFGPCIAVITYPNDEKVSKTIINLSNVLSYTYWLKEEENE